MRFKQHSESREQMAGNEHGGHDLHDISAAILRSSHGVQQALHSHPAGEQIIEHMAGSGTILSGIPDGIAITGDAR